MRKSLSLFSANLLFMITMLLVIAIGSLIQSVSLSWGLIATECILIAFPSILFLRQQRVPLREGLRLKPIPVLTGVLCVALGISAYLFGLAIEEIMAQLTGMQSVSIPSTLLPKSSPDMIVYFLALAVFAPLGEEILFRGAIQGAYEEKKSAGFAISVTAIMFAFYHFRLSGLPALLPIAFILCYVVWKTRSVLAGMLIHFGNNGASAARNIYYFTTGKALPFLSLWSALIGLLLAIVIILVIRRIHSTQAAITHETNLGPGTSAARKTWLLTYWPLIISGILYLSVAGLTLVQTLQARFAPSTQVSYGLPILHAPVQSHYAITNEGGQSVEDMDCTLFPAAGSLLSLDCSRTVHAFEITVGNSFYKDGNHEDSISITWDATTMELLSFSSKNKYDDGSVTASSVENGKLVSTDATGAHELALPENALIEFEWAWHVALLRANSGQSFSIPFGYLMRWDEKTNTSAPMVKNEILRVYDDEVISLPMGETTARKLTLAGGSAWFAKDDAIAGLVRPVKIDDGMLIYSLEK
jgi:membrane protease YdiL (CAAX protease family)